MKTEAEVDEFGVLCVSMRAAAASPSGYWWAEAACWHPGAEVSVTQVDAEAAPLERIHELEAIVRGLREWCTEGGKAPWLAKSWLTTS